MRKTWASAFGFIILMVTAVAFASPVPDTGQTKCYNNTVEISCPSPGQPFYGQDANYNINPMSYTKLDGSGNALPDSATAWAMVKDNVTGLIWEMKTNKDGVANYNDPHDADNTYTWYDSNPATNGGFAGYQGDGTDTEDFIKALNDAHYGDYSDWRMPTLKELAYIVNYSISYSEPAIDRGYFPNMQPSFYWSSNTGAYSTSSAWGWGVDFSYGYDHGYNMRTSNYVCAVRGGLSWSFDTLESGAMDNSSATASYTDNGDGTVTDISSGLMWQKTGATNTQTWEQALACCENLNLGGNTDWRLPTIKELQSLVDYSLFNPVISNTFFPDTVSSFYWSSTTYAYGTDGVWCVNFSFGNNSGDFKVVGGNYVRAVRSRLSVAPIPPTPIIKANGQDVQITVSSSTPVSITASLEPRIEAGNPADWWFAYSSPWGLYSLDSNGWTPGFNLLFQYPLLSFSTVEILGGLLPVGDYAFYFIVDMSPNGSFDLPYYYDFVQVHVVN